MIENIQINIIDNTNNQNSLTSKKTKFCNFMERVTKENLIEFYNGKKICRINPIDGDDEIYVFVTKVEDDIIVKKSNLLYDCFNKICGLKQEEIDRMVREAEANKAEDERRRKEVETKNKAESYINTMEQRMSEVGDKVSEDVTNQLKADIADLRNDMNNLSTEELKNKLPEYEQRFARYEQAAQQAGAGYQAPNYDNNNSSSDDEGPINA